MTSAQVPECEEDTHFWTKRAKKRSFWESICSFSLVEAWRAFYSQASMATFIISLTHSLYFVWAKLFLFINEDYFSSLSTLVVCVCVASSSCLRVEAPTLFLSSCGFKNKFPHSLFQTYKKITRVSSTNWRSVWSVSDAWSVLVGLLMLHCTW